MGVLDRFERGVENVMQNAFARTFKAGVKPVELAAAVKRECDARAAVVDRGRTVAPNEYVISLSQADRAAVESWGEDVMRQEIADALRTHAERQRYAFVGTVEVAFDTDETLATGRYAVASRTTRGPVAPATSTNPNAAHPLLDIDGVRYYLTGESTVLGRGGEADIVVDDTGVSRRHVRLEVTPHGTILTDMGSTNGTFVEDQRVSEATLLDGNAITIGRTRMLYWDPAPQGEDD
ncbi:FhaA domain-containing protein [Demequina pelophila]|uniref:FhaA domain-containing protein n=1 Tax=Demequina pelophila TaxID=1638984 RepID=UPI0007834ED2|nr:DUF3662 and FHA domain-containing protein [Demequina pelophila]